MKTGSPLFFSVCVPCLNAAPFLRERFDTLLAQTHRDFEIVVLDGESTDGSWEIILEYAARDPRIRAHRRPKGGLYQDWNACIALARHPWIYVATADDTITPDGLAAFAAAIRERPEARIVGSRIWRIDAEGLDLPDYVLDRARQATGCRYRREGWCRPASEVLLGILITAPFTSITQMVFHRGVLDHVGWFDPANGTCADVLWQMRALSVVPAWFLPRRIGSWRCHPGQASKQVYDYPNLAHLAILACQSGLIRPSLGRDLALGFACGVRRDPVLSCPPARAARLARWFQGLGRLHRPRYRLTAVAMIALANRLADLVAFAPKPPPYPACPP